MMKADWGESTVVVDRYRSFRRVYFIDAGVDDSSQLLAQMRPGDIGVRLPYGPRALDTMVEYMATHPQPDAVALIAHGEPGAFQLGGQHINTRALMRDQSLWQRIGQYLGHRGSLALFSCRLAQGEKGQQFLKQLARISGITHIAASARTLSPQKGWWLNIRHGVPSQDVDVMASRFSYYPHALASTDIHFTFDKAKIEGKTAVETHDGLTMRVTAPGIPSVSFKGGMFAMESAKAKSSLIEVQFDQPVVLNDLFIRVIRFKDGSYGGTTFLYKTDAGEDKTSFYKTSGSHKRASFDQPFQTLTMEQVNPNFENSEYGIRWLLDYLKVTPAPQFESARYDADSGILTVEGRYFASRSNGDDIDASKITLVGQGGKSYTLTKASSGELSSDQQFSLQLSSADQAALTALMNQNGVAAFDDSAYQLHFAEGFNTPLPKISISAPSTSSSVTVSGIAPVDVTEAAYNMESGTLTISGSGFAVDPNADDIDAQSITLIGAGGERYTLSDTADVELSSDQRIQLSLSEQDQQALRAIWDQSGTQAHDATAYQVELSAGFMTARPGASGMSSVTVGQVPVADMVEVSYSAASGLLMVTGHDFIAQADGSDIDVIHLTITGANGRAYTLSDSSDVVLTDHQHFRVQLSDQDRAAVSRLLNENGLKAFDGTPYQLSAGAGFMPARDWISDAAVSTFEVTDVAPVAFSDVQYDMAKGLLSVQGSGFVADMSAADIDTSLLTLVGAGGERYTLSDTADVELSSDQRIQLSLSEQDQQALRAIWDQSGTQAHDATAYQVELSAGFMTARPGASGTSSVTVGQVLVADMVEVSYSAASGLLIVTGHDFMAQADGSDIDVSHLTITGANGRAYTLSDSSDVVLTDHQHFRVQLSDQDRAAVSRLLNENGLKAFDGRPYQLSAGAGFMPARDWISDAAVSTFEVTDVAPIAFSDVQYDMAKGLLSVQGSGFVADMSAADIDTSLLTLVGAGGERYTLSDTSDVELNSDQRFQLSLSDQDQQALRDLFDRSGDSAFDDTAYKIEWQPGAILAQPGASGQASLEAVEVPQPTIESARYDVKTGQLDVVGSGFLHVDDQLDVDASKITLVGDSGDEFTLMNTSDVNIKSGTSFTLTLSARDQKEVIAFLNQNGTVAQDNTAYSVKAASGFMVARDQVADVTNNSLTVFNIADSGPQPDPGTDPDPQPDPGADPDPQPGPGTDPDPQPNPGARPDPAPRPDPGTNPNPGTTLNPQPDPGADPDPDPAPRPDPEPQPDDGDGVMSEIELRVPSLGGVGFGDGNGDNIPDAEQASVTSLVFLETPMPISQPNNAPATYVSLSTDEGHMLQDVMQQDALSDLPTSMKMPIGMLAFKAVVLTGQVANFQLVVNDDLGVNGYWKQDAEGRWVNLASEARGGDMVTLDDHLLLSFSIMDGGEFDEDGEANGQIVDPGAPGRWVEPPMPFDETHHGPDHFDWFTLTD